MRIQDDFLQIYERGQSDPTLLHNKTVYVESEPVLLLFSMSFPTHAIKAALKISHSSGQ